MLNPVSFNIEYQLLKRVLIAGFLKLWEGLEAVLYAFKALCFRIVSLREEEGWVKRFINGTILCSNKKVGFVELDLVALNLVSVAMPWLQIQTFKYVLFLKI